MCLSCIAINYHEGLTVTVASQPLHDIRFLYALKCPTRDGTHSEWAKRGLSAPARRQVCYALPMDLAQARG